MELAQLKNKTVWVFMSPNSKWRHNLQPIESHKVLGRITSVHDNSITLRDSFNKPGIIRMSDIQRIVPVNKEMHVSFMMTQLENVVCGR